MSTKADVVLGRQDHVERDHRRERRAQVLLEVIRDTQQDDGFGRRICFQEIELEIRRVPCSSRRGRVLPGDGMETRRSRQPVSTTSKESSQVVSFLSFPLPSRLICQIVGPCVGFTRLSM